MTRLLLALLTSLAANSALAQIYKCTQSGQTVFADRPCDATASVHRAASTSPRGTLDFQVPVRHYAVSGPTFGAALLAIRKSNPGGFAGFARWKVNYSFEPAESAGNCSIAAAHVQVVGDILMPEWVDERQANPQDQAYWRTSYAKLKIHEDGHIQHGREFALLLKERMLGVGKVPCTELDARIRREYESLFGNLRQRDVEYDRRTDHGLRQ